MEKEAKEDLYLSTKKLGTKIGKKFLRKKKKELIISYN